MNDYNQFLSFEETKVPKELSNQVFKKMDKLLNPKATTIFSKILSIHLVVGSLSLSVCHQFGINPFNTKFSLADVFMNWAGHGACMVFCGFLFTGLSIITAGYFLSIEELKVLKKTEFPQALVLSTLSLGLLFIFGAELVFSFAGLWLLGALIGSFLATEAAWAVRIARLF